MLPYKKILTLLTVCMGLSSVTQAQVSRALPPQPAAGTGNPRLMPVQRSYASFAAEYRSRSAVAGVSVPVQRTSITEKKLPVHDSYTATQSRLRSRYPMLQRQHTTGAGSRSSVLPTQRSYAYYQQQAQQRMAEQRQR